MLELESALLAVAGKASRRRTPRAPAETDRRLHADPPARAKKLTLRQ
ncbi:hypothetical protein [Streptomyces sp. SID4948]|nr:hypothetical protein [Streptomyces sp. SID4948]